MTRNYTTRYDVKGNEVNERDILKCSSSACENYILLAVRSVITKRVLDDRGWYTHLPYVTLLMWPKLYSGKGTCSFRLGMVGREPNRAAGALANPCPPDLMPCVTSATRHFIKVLKVVVITPGFLSFQPQALRRAAMEEADRTSQSPQLRSSHLCVLVHG